MIAALFLVSLNSQRLTDGSCHGATGLVLHRRWCPATNAAGSTAVVSKFFDEAKIATSMSTKKSINVRVMDKRIEGNAGSTTGDIDSKDFLHTEGHNKMSSWSLDVLPAVVETDVAYVVFRRLSEDVLLLASCQVEVRNSHLYILKNFVLKNVVCCCEYIKRRNYFAESYGLIFVPAL